MNQELVVVPKQVPMEVPAVLPPLPVWDEQIDVFLARVDGYSCVSKEDFERGKELAVEGSRLKKTHFDSFTPLLQAIDAIKSTPLELRKEGQDKIANVVSKIDATCGSWKREQDRLAQEEAERQRQIEIARREAARQEEIKRQEAIRLAEIERLKEQQAKSVEIAEEWGEVVEEPAPIVEPPPVVVPEIIPPRHITTDSGLSWRKGGRTKPRMVVTVVDPDAVDRKYCSPDPVKYKAAAASYFALIKNPTPEQVKKIEDEIGGVAIIWE